MRRDSPTLLRDSWLLRVEDLRGLPKSINRLGTHLVETTPPSAFVHSDLVQLKVSNAYETIPNLLHQDLGSLEKSLISHTLLKEWLDYLVKQAQGDKRAVGQRLRGFSTFCIS
jgi:hypothetical protein